jgi:hypothetical protein
MAAAIGVLLLLIRKRDVAQIHELEEVVPIAA